MINQEVDHIIHANEPLKPVIVIKTEKTGQLEHAIAWYMARGWDLFEFNTAVIEEETGQETLFHVGAVVVLINYEWLQGLGEKHELYPNFFQEMNKNTENQE
jgi:hypothetical protein